VLALSFALVYLWRRQVRVLQEVDRRKDELISLVSHQLVTPISSVGWQLEGVIDGDFGGIPQDARHALLGAVATTRNLSDLTSLLLDLSRVELGRLKMAAARGPPGAVRGGPRRHRAEGLGEGGPAADDAPEGAGHAGPQAHAHGRGEPPEQRREVHAGGRHVELAAGLDGTVLRFTVRDTGIGIPRADRGKLFGKLFRRGTSARSRQRLRAVRREVRGRAAGRDDRRR
jgi:signal transduction histidine kinase